MDIYEFFQKIHSDMRHWRHYIHQHPETAFEEIGTSDFISDKLESFGLQVHRGLAKTGVVATLTVGAGTGNIALRADMDALFIDEINDFDYKSVNKGKMHACGHDGHSAMLLGAARYLSEHQHFSGTVHFIFQPAEEGLGGGKQMIDEGLFELFPTDSVYGMHNFPDVPLGHFAVKPGAIMAAFSCFEINITGIATHAAMPHLGNDPIIASAQLITALQTIVSRNIDPSDPVVVSITQIHAGNTWNALPESVLLRGTCRFFNSATGQQVEDRIKHITQSLCACFDVTVDIVFNPDNPGYPVTVNTKAESKIAAEVAAEIAGFENVDLNPMPSMGAEDFAFMLQKKPGCYIWIGNGPSAGSCLLHNPHYDFNDAILSIGAGYWVRLVERILK
jgi:hippurate hydrolase